MDVVYLGMHCALYLPAVNRCTGGGFDALDSIPTANLPESFWISFQDNNETTQTGTMNFYLAFGAVPEGYTSSDYVLPLDAAISRAFWRKG